MNQTEIGTSSEADGRNIMFGVFDFRMDNAELGDIYEAAVYTMLESFENGRDSSELS
jgi:hypothetical protein